MSGAGERIRRVAAGRRPDGEAAWGRMLVALWALSAGALFGAGLWTGGMVDPARVQGFLDVTARWDATLAFVMGGAILPMLVAWRWQRRAARPLGAGRFDLPTARVIDRPLMVGAALFGAGWGLAGLCPGPALVALTAAPGPAASFVGAMLAGMAAHGLVRPRP